MAIQYVNTGSSANKGDGDSLRTAFNKINANFLELSGNNPDFVGNILSNSIQSGITVTYNTATDRATFVLNTATTSTIGGIKVGPTLSISASGLLNFSSVGSDVVYISNATSSTTSTNGALTVEGGVGIKGNLYVGGTISAIGTDKQVQFNDSGIIGTNQFFTYDKSVSKLNLLNLRASGVVEVGNIQAANAGTPIVISTLNGATVGAITIKTGDAGNSGAPVEIKAGNATIGSGGSSKLQSGSGQSGGSTYVWAGNGNPNSGGSVEILAGNGVYGGGGEARLQSGASTFGDGGDVALAAGSGSTQGGDITLDAGNASSGPGGNIVITPGNSTTQPGTVSIYDGSQSSLLTVSTSGFSVSGNFVPGADLTYDLGSTSSQWRSLYVGAVFTSAITNGSLVFPDGSTQTSAYRFVTPPVSSTSTGIAGSLAKDANYFYVCTATNAWQRIAWNNTPW